MGNPIRKFFLSLVLAISLSLGAFPFFAFAAEDIIQNQNTTLPERQMAENVVVFGGDATIYGSVQKAVIVFDGNLELKPSARVMGLVLVMGGSIKQDPQAQITDNIININFNNATKNSMLMGTSLLIGFYILSFFISALFIFIPVILHFLARNKLDPLVSLVSQRPQKSVLLGMATSLLLLGLSVLLSITLIGIPVAGILLLLVIFIFFIGLTIIARMVGNWVPGKDNRPVWLTITIGSFLLAAAMNLPLLGMVIFFLLLWYSLGISILWAWNWRQRRKMV